ncbi:MAG: tetratricopeptide repeat protein [Rhizobiaceae bacterium]
MQSMNRKWLAGVAMAITLAALPVAAGAKEQDSKGSVVEQVEIGNFSGAYLAARIAEIDNDLGSAIAYYRRALAFDPDNKQLQQSLLLGLIADGQFEASLPLAEKLKTEPEVERFSRLALAVESFRKKDYAGAQNWLKLVLESDLDRLIVNLMSAWAQEGSGDTKGADDTLKALTGPDWYQLFVGYHRALIADEAGQQKEAQGFFQATVDNVMAGSAAPDTWLRAAEAYAGFLSRQGEKAKALEVLDRADEFASGRPPIIALRAKIEKGEPVAPIVAGANAGATEVLLNLATALNRGGGDAFVRLYLQYALALEPQNDNALMQLANVFERLEQAEQAIAVYGRIAETSPYKRLAELQRGLNLSDLDRHDEAVDQLTKLLDAAPDDMRGYLALGSVYAAKEDYKSAAGVYDRAVLRLQKPTVNDWNIFYQRGIAYERLKEWPKAEPNFRKALELYPDQPQVLNYLGYSWVDMNMNLEEGLDMIRRAVDLRPSDGYIVDSLGWAYYRLDRFADAVRELERAVSLKPDDPVLNDHLGDAYWRIGRRLEATFQWAHARDLKPDADVLAGVQKKLAEGMPALTDKTVEDGKTPDSPTPQSETEKRSEAAPAEDKPAEAAAQPVPVEAAPAQVAPAAAETAVVIPAAYTVLPGQSLWSIAADRLGAGSRYPEIIELNPELKANPGRLVPGQALKLPTATN